MSFKQRERKRKRRAAVPAAQKEARRSGSASPHWWLTIVIRNASCNRCGGALRMGRPMVYRAVPREVICIDCAERDGVSSRPSVQWEQARVGGRS
jgi:hypothetical protein